MPDDKKLCPILAVLRTATRETSEVATPDAGDARSGDTPLDVCREERCAWWHSSRRCAILVIARRLGSRG